MQCEVCEAVRHCLRIKSAEYNVQSGSYNTSLSPQQSSGVESQGLSADLSSEEEYRGVSRAITQHTLSLSLSLSHSLCLSGTFVCKVRAIVRLCIFFLDSLIITID